MRIPRIAAIGAAVVVAAAGVALTVDSVSVSRTEAAISARIASDEPRARVPSVMVNGLPTQRWSAPDTLASVSVRVEGIMRPGLGPVAVEADATDVHLPDDPARPMTAGPTTVSVKITGDSLGPALGMRDVLVAAADDPSLAGDTERRAKISGTLTESGHRVSAYVDLVVVDGEARLDPHAPATGPGGLPDQDRGLAMSSTALTLEPDVLPLGVVVDTLTVQGGTITAAGDAGPGPTPLDDLALPGN